MSLYPGIAGQATNYYLYGLRGARGVMRQKCDKFDKKYSIQFIRN